MSTRQHWKGWSEPGSGHGGRGVDAAGRQPAGRHRRARWVLAVDGKAMRATRHGSRQVHLLGVLDHARGVALAQVDVDEKTNEIPLFSTVLDQIPT
ncbi:hypothetical protein [Parafrankia sp. FMc2]|uniref:hypothetical protein n=1 Tax=Parafrankia sp. FMc2 TaxID=3233196 RepID=UPI0034D3E8CB